MKYLILLSILLLAGCTRDYIVTTTTHHVVQERDVDQPVGYFTLNQKRWAYDTAAASDILVEFRNTTAETLSFNFCVNGQGWTVNDAVVDLAPDRTYTVERRNVPYFALDYWRVSISKVVRKP